MKQIPSFQIDHTCLKRGLYTSQSFILSPDIIIDTLDIRICEPYVDKPMSPAIAHAIEHIGATFLRNKWAESIIYFGPMGCLTGFYLVLYKTKYLPNPYWIVLQLFQHIVNSDNIPGATKVECGNYKMMDLEGAKLFAIEYLRTLIDEKEKYNGKNRYSYKTGESC